MEFGTDVDIEGDTLVVGTGSRNGAPVDYYGFAYIYDLSDGSKVSTISNPDPGLGSFGRDGFGDNVIIDNGNVYVSFEDYDDGIAAGNGAVYKYDSSGNFIEKITNQTGNNFKANEIDPNGNILSIAGNAIFGGLGQAGRISTYDSNGNLLTEITDNGGRAKALKIKKYQGNVQGFEY